jgi:hypothetical protein
VVTLVWQKWRFNAPQTHLWLIKVWFSASTFVVKIATFAKPENVTLIPTSSYPSFTTEHISFIPAIAHAHSLHLSKNQQQNAFVFAEIPRPAELVRSR